MMIQVGTTTFAAGTESMHHSTDLVNMEKHGQLLVKQSIPCS
jgi:hypothetical protein